MTPTTNTFIRSYGMFWRREEVNWSPRITEGGPYRLLGRKNHNQPALQVCDFRNQAGIYVLYDDYGPYYVGLAKTAIGNRLRDHTRDDHKNCWDRFSWFGFRRVKNATDDNGLQQLGVMPKQLLSGTTNTIRDIEALLMMSLGTIERGNAHTMKFANADRWHQIPLHDADWWLDRI